jgi:hypothetical protein
VARLFCGCRDRRYRAVEGAAMTLASPYAWIIAFAGLILVGSAASYIRHATVLARCINERCPALWDKLRFSSVRPTFGVMRAGRLETLVLFNVAAADHPDDPQLKWHLEQARWSIAVCGVAFLALTIALAKAYPQP